ncbi:MAG TPA: hypothetical protein VF781_04340 [Solirubrobacteraceae bacterium]
MSGWRLIRRAAGAGAGLKRPGAALAVALTAGGLSAAALTGTPAALAGSSPPPTPTTRLQGQFTATGTVMGAVNVPDEYRGEPVSRTWTFVPQCPSGGCATVQLIRQRGATGQDTLMLVWQAAGYYKGSGTFTAPVSCAGRVYANGELARYTITLTITSTASTTGSTDATGFTATYRNPSRTGLTKCYTAPSYDWARYTGAPAAPPAGG